MFIIIFIFNISLYYFLQYLKLKYLSSFFKDYTNPALNPFVILFLFQLPIDLFKVVIGPPLILEKGVYDLYYNFAIFLTSVGLFCEYLLFRFAIMVSRKYTFNLPSFSFKIRKNRMIYASLAFFILYIFSFSVLASSNFGILNWLKDPRTGYQLYRTGNGQFWLFAISFLSISFCLAAVFIEKTTNLFIVFLPYLYCVYLLGSKGFVLDFFIFFLIMLSIRNYKYINRIFIFGIPSVFILMLINFFSNLESSPDFKAIYSYFDYYVNSAMYFEAYFSGKIDLFWGKIYLSDFWALLPRGLFPNKPYVYGITYVNEFFFPGAADETNFPAFGGPINYFADFGILGVILLTFFNPFRFIFYFFLGQLLKEYNYENIKHNSFLFLLFSFFTAPAFLILLPLPLNMFFLLFIAIVVLLINKIKIFK